MKKKINVLVVDDDPSLLAVLERAAQSTFPEITFDQVYSTAQAITHITELTDNSPAFILLSIESKDTISGFNFLAFLKDRSLPFLAPVFMLSAGDFDQDSMDAYSFGARSCVIKPHNTVEWAQYLSIIRLHFY